MKKAGLVISKPVSSWLEPTNPGHVLAVTRRLVTGHWPPNFLPAEVHEDCGWEAKAKNMEIPSYSAEYDRVRAIIADIKFSGYEFTVEPVETRFALRVQYMEADVDNPAGPDVLQRGRELIINQGETECQIVQAAFRCVMASIEHRVREHFEFRGKRVMNPHREI